MCHDEGGGLIFQVIALLGQLVIHCLIEIVKIYTVGVT